MRQALPLSCPLYTAVNICSKEKSFILLIPIHNLKQGNKRSRIGSHLHWEYHCNKLIQGPETKLVIKQQQKELLSRKGTVCSLVFVVVVVVVVLFCNVLSCAFLYQCDFLTVCLVLLLSSPVGFLIPILLHSTPTECLTMCQELLIMNFTFLKSLSLQKPNILF